jgi:ABC-type Fe3+-hydroxamate transport system substrate-binding protein
MNDRRSCAGTPAFPLPRKRALLCLAALCTGGLATQSCADTSRVHSNSEPARRIVSLVPSATEILVELGAADRIIGRTDYDTDARLAGVASFGRNLRASVEAVVAQTPDLVIDPSYARWPASPEVVHRARIATLTTDLQTFADILALIDTLGVLVGVPQRAAALRAELEDGAAQLRRTAPAHRPAALYLVWPDPPRTISSTSYLNEVIELAGARNAFPELRAAWPEISMEVILQRNPGYIIVATEMRGAAERLRAMDRWKNLSAIRANHVIEVPVDLFHRPGPRVIEAARWLRNELQRAAGERCC